VLLKDEHDINNKQDYNLLVIGHSMGAGVAALLAILLHNEYSTLECYSYSPPGGLLSENCMEATKDFITTVILGKDMIPRLGMMQLEKLRNEIMKTLKDTNKPKVFFFVFSFQF
jgi:sn1-specific diacylglycerol lipase